MPKKFKGASAVVLGGLVLLVSLHESLAAPPARGEKPVAVVLGREIPREALAPDEKTRQSRRAAMKPEEYARWESSYEVQRLQERVLGPLLKAYAQRKGLEPTKEELQAFDAASSKGMEESLARTKKDLESLRAELQREDLTPEKRRALQARLESAEQVVRLLSEDVDRAPSMGAKGSDMVARSMVLSWKTQRALHREYGGDIIFQQSGPEAVGAYLPFLEERQKAGDFKLLDEELSRRFWEHVRKAPGIRIKQDALETPWWLKKPEPSPKR
ncbi:hypothetical protein HPC49_17335 [Pyxidicoccus fallax]|uniref:PpiC domain-containing protein n=1 Tax=Pyxidicoccus fallax TaxID=394095 RepID=A0A848L891_9BACT|nr:hypothetical protein [Pyxidicoccus fallax]NMO14786.1 hypothetical protein [Pyxidicoccus fallax]NPC79976.1 hypothetical protein [Pyxidicoccus fallax]